MSDIRNLNLLNFLLFVSLIHEIRGGLEEFMEQTTKWNTENIDDTITLNSTVNQFIRNFKPNELSKKEMAKVLPIKLSRRTREIESITLYTKHYETTEPPDTTTTTISPLLTSTLDCYHCSATINSGVYDPCYVGSR